MSLVAKLTYRNLILISFLVFGTGCALLEGGESQKVPEQIEQVYRFELSKVWRAAQIAIQDYPILVNELDRGVIETEAIKDQYAWNPPHTEKVMGSGRSYRLILKIVKGSAAKQGAVRVAIKKEITRKRDFFSESQTQPSDGLEEKTILYRIQRELELERAIERHVERKNKST